MWKMIGNFELKVLDKMGRKLIEHKNTYLYKNNYLYNRISECFRYFRFTQ